MKIAVVSSPERGEIDRLIAAVAERLQAEGAALAGIVKVMQRISEFDNGCDMDVRVLPGGPVIAITQSLGKGSDSCRLDPGGIAQAVSAVERGGLDNVDLLVLNKFGPEESSGRGFCPVFGEALERGVPILVGVGAASRAAFDLFVEGMAEDLGSDQNAILDWCRSRVAERRLEAAS